MKRNLYLLFTGALLLAGFALTLPMWASEFAVQLAIQIMIFGLMTMSVSFWQAKLG